jgi:ribosome-binding factor A
MKRKHISRKELLSSCSETGPEDGSDPRLFFRNDSGRQASRKTLQLCAHTAQVVGQILAWETDDDLLSELVIVSVVPAPSSSRLLVTFSAASDADDAAILERLQRQVARLRTELGLSVQRRRVPELSFRVLRRGTIDL